jgi:hypothetical protein
MFDLLQSRKFWLALVSLLVVVVLAFSPGFVLDQEAFVGLILIVVAYMVSLALDPGDPAAKWASLLKSRKFYAALVGILMMVMDGFGWKLPADVNPDALIGFAVLIGGYIASVALENKPIL